MICNEKQHDHAWVDKKIIPDTLEKIVQNLNVSSIQKEVTQLCLDTTVASLILGQRESVFNFKPKMPKKKSVQRSNNGLFHTKDQELDIRIIIL
jgi:hypothetical protein